MRKSNTVLVSHTITQYLVVLELVKDAIQVLEYGGIGVIPKWIPELVQPYVLVCINQNVHLFNNA